MEGLHLYRCPSCDHVWETITEDNRTESCPRCCHPYVQADETAEHGLPADTDDDTPLEARE